MTAYRSVGMVLPFSLTFSSRRSGRNMRQEQMVRLVELTADGAGERNAWKRGTGAFSFGGRDTAALDTVHLSVYSQTYAIARTGL